MGIRSKCQSNNVLQRSQADVQIASSQWRTSLLKVGHRPDDVDEYWMILMLFIVRMEHPAEEQWPSNSDQKSSSFEAASSKKIKSDQTSSSEGKPALSSSSEKMKRMLKPESSPRSGRMAWPDEKRQEEGDSSDKDEKTKEAGKKKRKKRRRRRRQKYAVDQEVDAARQSWRRGETSSSSASSGNKGNSRENNGRGPVEKDAVETVIEAEKGGVGESDGCILSKEDGDAFDAGIVLDVAAGRRALRMKRSFATTADSSEGEVVKIEDKLKEEGHSVSSWCKEEGEEKSRLLGGNFELAVVHNCSDQEVLMTISTSEEKAEKGFEIDGNCLLLPGCSSFTAKDENESEKELLNSDLEEDTSKCSLGVVGMGVNDVMSANEKEDEIFDPPSTEILDYKSILSALKEKHREQQRKLLEEASSPSFWPHSGL